MPTVDMKIAITSVGTRTPTTRTDAPRGLLPVRTQRPRPASIRVRSQQIRTSRANATRPARILIRAPEGMKETRLPASAWRKFRSDGRMTSYLDWTLSRSMTAMTAATVTMMPEETQNRLVRKIRAA